MRPWTLVLLAAVAATVGVAALLFLWSEVPPIAALQMRGQGSSNSQADTGWRIVDCERPLIRALAKNAPNRRAECGRLRVLESDASSRVLELQVVRLHPLPAATRVPLVLLPGGPGDAFIPGLSQRLPYILPLSKDRELIVMDPRGTGASLPRLDCPDTMRDRKGLARCFAGFQADLDPGAFSTERQLSDLLALLGELKVSKVAIYGVSYGTLVAYRFASTHPSRVDRLILDSPVPEGVDLLAGVGKNAQAALEVLLRACSNQAACSNDEWLDLSRLGELVARLDAPPHSAAPTGRSFLRGITSLMLSPTAMRFLPHVISEASRGKFQSYWQLMAAFGDSTLAFGVHLSVQCGEVYPLSSPESLWAADQDVLVPLRGALSARPYFDFCEEWKIPPVKVIESSRVALPALILSGRFDHLTPHSYAQMVAERLPQSELIVQRNIGHGVAFSACGAQAVSVFLSGASSVRELLDPPCDSDIEEIGLEGRDPTVRELEAIERELRYRL
jgi:pimeloyl-ACP methyl ester carboxylesterase